MKKNKLIILLLVVATQAAGTLCADWRTYNGLLSDEQALQSAIARSLVESYNGDYSEEEAFALALRESLPDTSNDEAIARALQELFDAEAGFVLEEEPAEQTEPIEQTGSDQGLRCLEEECPICLEEYGDDDEVMVLPCGHSFHASCIQDTINSGYELCAICRANADVANAVIGAYKNLRPADNTTEREEAQRARAEVARNRPPAQHNGISYADGWDPFAGEAQIVPAGAQIDPMLARLREWGLLDD